MNTKTICTTILLFLWLVFTIILTFSIVGLLLFIEPASYSRSTWMQIGVDLNDNLLK